MVFYYLVCLNLKTPMLKSIGKISVGTTRKKELVAHKQVSSTLEGFLSKYLMITTSIINRSPTLGPQKSAIKKFRDYFV